MNARRIATLAVVAATLLAGVGVAQDAEHLSVLRHQGAADIYAELVSHFSEQPDGIANRVRIAVYEALGFRDSTLPDDQDPPICAYAVGSGGNPRWNGGGSQVGYLSPDFPRKDTTADIVVSLASLPQNLVPTKDIVIIDEFNVSALRDAFENRLGGDGRLPVGASNAEDLWRVLYDALYPYVKHGHLVAFHTLAHVASADDGLAAAITEVQENELGLELTLDVQGGSGQIQVHFVNISFDNTQSIGNAIRAQEYSSEDAVVIMSWGLVDCTVRDAYASLPGAAGDDRDVTLVDYLVALMSRHETAELVQELCAVLEVSEIAPDVPCTTTDPAQLADVVALAAMAEMDARASDHVLAEDSSPGSRAGSVYFAAAGNASLPFPMPPAGWPGIVGVEACTWNITGRARFSNAGAIPGLGFSQAVRALGAWFEAPVQLSASAEEPLGYWGTSFAAPAAAVQYAAGQFKLKDDEESPTESASALVILDPCQEP